MKLRALFLAFLGIGFIAGSALAAEPVFRLHLPSEPSHLTPQRQKSSAASYLLGNLHRNLLRFDNDKGLVPDLAKSCTRKSKTKVICQLRSDLKWSDGGPLVAKDFIRTYEKLLDPQQKAPRADLLFSVLNAKEIFTQNKSKNTLGVKALSNHILEFTLAAPDPDFEYALTSVILSPTPAFDKDLYSGPYQLKEWKKGQGIRLVSNKYYVPSNNMKRPEVEFLFLSEDNVALQLYEKDQLSFLRRLPTLYLGKFKSRPDFHWIPMLRMDYLGFGPALKDKLTLRKALSESLKYEELQKIFSSEGRPGCIGLPAEWFPAGKVPCYDFKPTRIQDAASLTLMYSSQGGEDHKRATEWMQNQWLQNAGVKVQLVVKENKLFLNQLETAPPEIFRKGHALDRPTCLAAVEVFQTGQAENYIQLKSKSYDKNVQRLRDAPTLNETKKLCLEITQSLLTDYQIIPLGAINFAMLAKPEFKGWKINQMNQLDLSELQFKP